MRILTPDEQRKREEYAIQMGCLEESLMEQAGKGVAEATLEFLSFHKLPHTVGLLVGKGNNGGDAFTAGCYLLEKGVKVTAIPVEPLEKASPLCQKQGNRFVRQGGTFVDTFSSLPSASLLLDGLFGTGFRGAPEAAYADLIRSANRSGLPILAIDIPSGLNGSTGEVESVAIEATATLFLEFPKRGFFFGKGWEKVGHLHPISLSLPPSLHEESPDQFQLITRDLCQTLLPPLSRSRHKYQSGYVAGVAGSVGMEGAAMLAALGTLRGGGGVVRLFHPKEATPSPLPLEILKRAYTTQEVKEVAREIEKAHALFLGPGLGRKKETALFLHSLSPFLSKPTVIDADALYHFSLSPFPLPKNVLFTPHRGELAQLLQIPLPAQPTLAETKTWRNYAQLHGVTLLIKGPTSWIVSPDQPIWVNSMGDATMATAGSGDVLTGLLAALLAQNLSPTHAAIAGSYVHGLAGRIAAAKWGSDRGVIASDILQALPEAFSHLLPPRNRPNRLWI